jgi:flagellar hook-basal body complex protein FliE
MSIEHIGKMAKIGVDAVQSSKPAETKKVGETSDFEKLRMEKLDKEQQVTGLKVQDVQFNENVLSRIEAKQVENDFTRQIRARGPGSEMDVLSEKISDVKQKMDAARNKLPGVEKSEFSESVHSYLSEVDSRFKSLNSISSDIMAGDRQYSMQDLLKIQVQMHGLSQNLEVLTKVIDKVTEGMKTILRTQV